MSPGVPQFDPEFQTHLSLRFSACRFHPNRFPVKTETFLRAAPRARLGKISSGQPSLGPFQPNLGMSPGVPQFDPEFQTHLSLRSSACGSNPNRFPVKTETFLRAAPRARLGKISSGQPSPGPFQPNLGMSPGVPQFDPEFQTHLSLRFSACRFHPNRFPVKTETFLRAAPRARLAKISSGQPSPGPFQPNLGMSPGVPQFDPEFQTHLSLRFSSMPIPPKSIPGQNGNFFARRAARAPGQNQFWPAQPRAIPAKPGYVTGGTPVRPRISNPSFPTFFSMPIPPKSIPDQNGNFFARRAARAPGQNQFWPAQPRAIPAKPGYVTGGTPVRPRISNPSFPTFFSMPIPPKSPGQNGNFFARRAARAPGQNQFWPAQPRAIPAKPGYVTGGTPVRPRISNPSFPTFFSMPIPPKSIHGQNGNFFARRAARAPGQNQFWPAQPRAIPAKSGYVTGGTPV